MFGPFLRLMAGAGASSRLAAVVSAADRGATEAFCARLPAAGSRQALPDRKKTQALRSRCFWNGSSFPHDERATFADRLEFIHHGRADLQEQLAAMAHDLARRLKQPPAHGLHLRPLPSG